MVLSLSSEASFLCTFCWCAQFPPAKPKVLGREARIACVPCWRSVLDLSICWVCGEMVGRGEEVVSLGWCFWHRGCFGCLLCGTHLDPPVLGDEDGALEDDGEEGIARGATQIGERASSGTDRILRRACQAVELENIPLCTWCESVTESMSDKEVLENGLINISRKDGGLSRSRLALLTGLSEIDSDDIPRQTPEALMKTGKKDVIAIPLKCLDPNHPFDELVGLYQGDRGYEKQAGLLRDDADMGMGEDGNLDIALGRSSPTQYLESMETPALYVSVLGVLNEPAFRPSKTKPIPKWMSLLPRNRQGVENPHLTSTFEAKLYATESSSLKIDESQGFHFAPGPTNTRFHESHAPVNSFMETAISKDGINHHNANPHRTADLQSGVQHTTEIEMSGNHTSRSESNSSFKRSDTPYPFAGTASSSPHV